MMLQAISHREYRVELRKAERVVYRQDECYMLCKCWEISCVGHDGPFPSVGTDASILSPEVRPGR